jgi:hypothetical protein
MVAHTKIETFTGQPVRVYRAELEGRGSNPDIFAVDSNLNHRKQVT